MKSSINYIWEYKDRWDDSDLPVWINEDNYKIVSENCKRCLSENKRYSELFGEQNFDPEVLY